MKNGKNKVLFLCTGNYYRSRIAEELFNYYSDKSNLNWIAHSAGLAKEINKLRNPGPISIHALAFLEKVEIQAQNKDRYPESLDPDTINGYKKMIAVDKKEHESMVRSWFDQIPENLVFWDIQDVDLENPITATARLHDQVKQLISGIERSELKLV